jgi:phage terminase large subunit-like protein
MPTKDMIQKEYMIKWMPEFLPKGDFRKRGQYAWEPEFRNRYLWAIHFTGTGISVYMHTYAQDVHHLQAGTVDALFVDEEPPWELMPELLMRLAATNGYFNAVMTPTIGQDQWRRAFEVDGYGEIFQGAHKQRVSVFDCMTYDNGKPSRWTEDRIKQMMGRLGTQQEIDLRIYGKFVAQDGLKVPAFSREKNIVPKAPIPSDWLHFSGVDIGSGGKGHPPAIIFVAVRPDFQKGVVNRIWRGERSRNYTVTDILEQYTNMRGSQSMTGQYYDFASAEFGLMATRAGLGFEKAEKSHEAGFPLLNSLFKNQMLDIQDVDGYDELVTELVTCRHDGRKVEDDLLDALRYAVAKISWNFENIEGDFVGESKKEKSRINERPLRPTQDVYKEPESWDPASEIAEYNKLYGFSEEDSW